MTYSRIARRIRVPLGFICAAIFLWLARPTWISLAFGAVVMAPGLWLRALAAGHVRKNAELTTSGPYAYTRNPLYLGSILIAVGFAVAANTPWGGLLLIAMFLAIYLPVIRSEEAFLRGAFPGFDDYAEQVPRLLPRLTPANRQAGSFSRELYRKHREYNALIGAGILLLALVLKLMFILRA
ncbi:MAG TPA: isoprenylcysteine carboxylmethyltransferase family protein [Terriglobales bacterium]|nr:isoprenylcysteine carboxylmethyltransferase family protein [Terriglobales bacterium]